ncbi:MAG: MBL fold metallo-hydrolase [Myxococcota bacterium]
MVFRQLFDRETCTYTYLVGDEQTGLAVLIDSVLECVDRDATLIEELGLSLIATLETHIHADHVTAASALRARLGSQVWVPAVAGVQGADRELAHGETVTVGALSLEVRATPGHTSTCTTYVLHGGPTLAFTGDALMIRGCGRTDFQQGCAETLYGSVHEQILSLPDDTLVYPGHDYKGRTRSTVAEEKAFNPRLGGGRTVQDFEAIMAGLKLAQPQRIDVAVPANLRAGAE